MKKQSLSGLLLVVAAGFSSASLLFLYLFLLLFNTVPLARTSLLEGKAVVWRELLAETWPASAALDEIAKRLADLPDQHRATLLYLALTSKTEDGGSHSNNQRQTKNCQLRISLAQLNSPKGPPSQEALIEALKERLQQDELPEGALSAQSLQDAELRSWLALAQRLALDNANLLTRLGLRAPALASEFVADEHFSKYLLELGLLNQRLVPARSRSAQAHPNQHPVQSVGLVFYKPATEESSKQQVPEVEFAWLAEPASPRARLIDLKGGGGAREGVDEKLDSARHAYFGLNHLALPFYTKWMLNPEELQLLAKDLLADGSSLGDQDGHWFSPYKDCGFSNRWLLTYSVPLFQRNTNGLPVFRGVSFASLDFARLNMLNQCVGQQYNSLPPEEEAASEEMLPEESDAARWLFHGTSQCSSQLKGSKCLRIPPSSSESSLRLLGHYLCLCPSSTGKQVAATNEELKEALDNGDQLELKVKEWAQNFSIPLNLLPLDSLNDAPESLPGEDVAELLSANSLLEPHIRHFQLGRQLEPRAALNWLLDWPEAKWLPLSCRACLNTTTSITDSNTNNNNDSTQPCQESKPTTGTLLLNDAPLSHWHPIRPLVAGLQATGSLLMLLLLGLLMRLRKSRVIIASGRFMLTTTLIGALFLYSSVMVRCLKTSSLSCLLEAWFRELGFSIFYGSLLIKLYRIYTEFQTRKAHRVCLRDKDQMAYLMAIVFIVISYMSSWTALVLDGFLYKQQQQTTAANKLGILKTYSQPVSRAFGAPLEQLFASLVEQQHRWEFSHHPGAGISSSSKSYELRCRKLNWDYVTELNEIGLLLFGIYLIYKVRNASTKSHKEKLVLSVAFFLELIVSGTTYAIRHSLWDRLTGNQLLLLYCARCQLTVTPTLALVFAPKLWGICRSSRQTLLFGALKTTGSSNAANNASLRHRCHISCELHDHHLDDAMRLHQAMLSSATLDIGSINLVDMSPDEIKAELKRVYAQLELFKNKAMRRDNPHISRRRGGRKTGHRKFSLQAFHPRHIAVGSLGKQQHQASHHLRSHTGAQNDFSAGPAYTLEELEEETEEELADGKKRFGGVQSGDMMRLEAEVGGEGEGMGEAEAEAEEAEEEEEEEGEGEVEVEGEERSSFHAVCADSRAPRPLPAPATAHTGEASQAQAHNSGPKRRLQARSKSKGLPHSSIACFNAEAKPLMINDSQSSGNLSPQACEIQSASFVCSQSSIQAEESSSLNKTSATGFTFNCT